MESLSALWWHFGRTVGVKAAPGAPEAAPEPLPQNMLTHLEPMWVSLLVIFGFLVIFCDIVGLAVEGWVPDLFFQWFGSGKATNML